MPKTLIICPTHDHADTLFASIASVQAQRETDWEMVVICDGAPERTAQILDAICATDPRVRFEVHPKGDRLGEAYRDPVIRASDAEFICHIGDDDLWCDRHLGYMTQMLANADFAMQGTLELGSGGTWAWNFANCGTGTSRTLAGGTRPVLLTAGLNCFAVRRSAYERLDRGWSPAPSGIGSDVFMCVEYVKRRDMRIASSADVTFAKLPSRLERRDFGPERRLVELTPVLARINTTGYLSGRQREAVVGMPVMRALHYAGARTCDSLEAALSAIGIRLGDVGETPTIAIGEEAMVVPLNQPQRVQCEMAWRLLQVTDSADAASRLQALVRPGFGWLLTPYLETWGESDPEGALMAADVLRSSTDQSEVGTAFVIRSLILATRLVEAREELNHASRAWPNAGWLQTMEAWYADTLQRSEGA